MFRKFIGVAYVLNIVFSAIFTLATPIGLCLLASWLLVEYASVGKWIYALLITVGALVGLVSMVRFVTSAMSAYERLERQDGFGKLGGSDDSREQTK